MYARCLRRVVSRPLTRQRPSRLLQRRWIIASEPAPTLPNASPPPTAFLDETKNVEIRRATSGSVVNDAMVDYVAQRIDEEPGLPTAYSDKPIYKETLCTCSIHVFPEARALSMPGIFALVRELEQQFGSVREFRILRDKDSPSDYLRALFINFWQQGSVKKIRELFQGSHSGTIMIAAPPKWDSAKELDGGVSLEDVQPFLRPKELHITAMDVNEQDRQLVSAVESVEKALESPETEAEAFATEGTIVVSSSHVDRCEARIEILTDAFTIEPVIHEKPKYVRTTDQLGHITRSMLQWGGFYPHYRFSPYPDEENECILDGKVVENMDELTEYDRKRAETIWLATGTMRDALVRSRMRLHDLGQPDHGLVERDGRQIVLDWEAKQVPESSNGASEVLNAAAETMSDVECSDSQSTVAKSKWSKPNMLTPEAEQSLDSHLARSGLCVQSGASAVSPTATTVKTSSKVSPSSSSSPSSSQPRSPSPDSIPAPILSPQNIKATDEAPFLSPLLTTASSVDVAESKEAENNRARRARKKAEHERAGFKTKLLGWLGR